MAYEARKTEHNGAKKGKGAFWGRKKDAKPESNRRRREDDKKASADAGDDSPLTAMQIRVIERRAADLADPVRYLLASRMTPRFVLYYNVSDDTYVLNEPASATLFKRRKAAESVKRLLSGRIHVIRCTTNYRNGQRVPLLPRQSRGKKNA